MLKNNLNLLDNSKVDIVLSKSKDDFLISLNENELGILNLIKRNIEIINNISDMKNFQIIDFTFDNSYFSLEFNCDHESLSKIRANYFDNICNCPEIADKNFNKYKINKFFLLPIQFEIKIRNFNSYKDFILSSLLDIVKSKIIFDLDQNNWKFDGTIIHYFNLYNKHIKSLNNVEKNNVINELLKL